MDSNKIRLGDLAKDSLTGFTGVVVAITDWIHGCRRLTLQPRALKDGRPIESYTVDAPQCQLVKSGKFVSSVVAYGPRPDPVTKKLPD